MFALSAPDSPFMSISTRRSLWHVVINYTCCNHGKMNSLILRRKLFVIVCSSRAQFGVIHFWHILGIILRFHSHHVIPKICVLTSDLIAIIVSSFRFLGLFEGEISAPRNHRNNVSRCQWKHPTHRRYSNEEWIKESREASLGCCGRRKKGCCGGVGSARKEFILRSRVNDGVTWDLCSWKSLK